MYFVSAFCDDECGNTNVWKIDISKENDKKQPLLVKKSIMIISYMNIMMKSYL